MNHETFLAEIIGKDKQYNVVHGMYDTRPFVMATPGYNGVKLPVAYREEYPLYGYYDIAPINIPCGDVIWFLESLPEEAIVVVPIYHECSYCGENSFILTQDGWIYNGGIDLRLK